MLERKTTEQLLRNRHPEEAGGGWVEQIERTKDSASRSEAQPRHS